MTVRLAAAPHPAHRLLPARYPHMGAFDTGATAADLSAVMELAGWTDDRLVAERIARLPPSQFVYGRPNASVVMAAFLHVAPGGGRFHTEALGAWYAAAALRTAVAEVAHHLRREAAARGLGDAERIYRAYASPPAGAYRDIRDERDALAAVYDPADYAAGQRFGETVRASADAGIVYDRGRHAGGTALVTYRPPLVGEVTAGSLFAVSVTVAARRIEARRIVARRIAG